MRVQNNFLYRNFSGTQTVQIATGVGTLHSVTVNKTAAQPVDIVDGLQGTTATIATLKASIGEATYLYDCVFGQGLRISLEGNSDVTVTFNSGS